MPACLDKSAYQPFDAASCTNYLYLLQSSGDSIGLTPSLVQEYSSTEKITTEETCTVSGEPVVRISGSEYSNQLDVPLGELKLYNSFSSNEVTNFLNSSGLPECPMADAELLYTNIELGYATYTNDSRLIKKIKRFKGFSPCFRPSDILLANVMAGTLPMHEGERIWKLWGEVDKRFIPSSSNTLEDYKKSLEVNEISLLREHFRISN